MSATTRRTAGMTVFMRRSRKCNFLEEKTLEQTGFIKKDPYACAIDAETVSTFSLGSSRR